jgi:DNA-binding CsgD family transcriptional regulator/tetratricopeptide (TPR) repeat protein
VRRVVSPVLVAREDELALLGAAGARAAAGEAGVVLVGGEAGVGKTRVVSEAARRVEADGFRVLPGWCVELGGDALPLAPLVDVVRTLVRSLPPRELDAVLGPARPVLARLLPELGTSTAEGGELQPSRLFELVLGMLGRLAADRPVALVVEDLHWADTETLDLLAFLVRTLRQAPVLVVATFRSDELHRGHPLRQLLATLERIRSVDRLELRRFSREEVAAQLRGILDAEPAPALVDAVHQRSEGNAFLVEEMLEVVEAGADEVPPSLRDVLLARVDRLSEPTRGLLRTAAAAGGRVGEPLLAAVAGLDDGALLTALREAVEHHLLLVDDAGRYRFRHALARDAIYEELLPGERSRLHAAYGAAIEAAPSLAGEAPAAALAHHWYAALDLPRALTASVQAAREARRRFASAEAARHAERALELWERVPDPEERAGLDYVGLLELALDASVAAGNENRVVAHAEAAIAAIGDADPQRTAAVLARRADVSRWTARVDVSLLERAAELVGDEPTALRASILASLATALMLDDRYDEAAELAPEAVATAREAGEAAAEAGALIVLGCTIGHRGPLEEGLRHLRTAVELAQQGGDHETTLRAWANLSDTLELASRHREAVEAAAAGVALSEQVGLARRLGTFLAGNQAESLLRIGRAAEALELADRWRALDAETSSAASLEVIRSEVLVTLGLWDEAARSVASARAALGPTPPHQYQGHLSYVEGELARVAGRTDEVRAAVARGLLGHQEAMLGRYTWPLAWLGLRVEADLAETGAADPARVAELVDAAASYSTVPPAMHAFSRLAAAEAARASGADAPAAWREAAAEWRAVGQPLRLAYALRRLAAALVAAGERDEAATAAAEALELAAASRAEPLVAELEALIRRARLATPAGSAAVDPDPYGLTEREVDVLRLVAAGSSNAEIGAALFISPKTASVHVSNILGKLGVARRGEAAAIAHRLGLLERTP